MEPMETLTWINLSGCTRLKRLPNDHSFHNLNSLSLLRLDDTAITKLPSSIQHLVCLKHLGVSGCQNLTSLPSFIHNLRSLLVINASDLGIKDLPESICQLIEMKYLHLSGCKWLPSLPASLKQLSQLLELVVAGCSTLCSLPELPLSLEALNANRCVSLKTISTACFASESKIRILKFANCYNWNAEERRRVLSIAFSNLIKGIENSKWFEIMLPWSAEIPHWFSSRQSAGSSVTLKLPMDDQCYTLAFWVLIKPKCANFSVPRASYYYYNTMNCYVVDDNGYGLPVTYCELDHLSKGIEHLLLWYNPWDKEEKLRKYVGGEVSLQFRDNKGEVEVIRCGVVIVSIQDIRNAESSSSSSISSS